MEVTDHPNYATLENRTNVLISRAITAQGIYFDNYDYFFQGIATPVNTPDGTTEGEIDVNVKPTDQIHSWNDFDPVGYTQIKKLPFRIRIDQYEAPEGYGWVYTIEFKYAGIGPDARGNDGDHWVYRYHEGAAPSGILEEWYIQPDIEVILNG